MPEFHLDTSGGVEGVPPVRGHAVAPVVDVRYCGHVKWSYLDAFTQGYIEALFASFEQTPEGRPVMHDGQAHRFVRFGDLAPETLARIIADCLAFQVAAPDTLPGDGDEWTKAGRDFWYTRNGHGAGFWDGDWPEPYASELDAAAKAAGSVDAYLGDDGKVWLS